jgi:ABC-type polysaccharide/polyol phosphate export permease
MSSLKIGWEKLKGVLGLSFALAKAQFKIRNEGSYLGILWYLLDPLLLFIIILMIRVNFDLTATDNYAGYLLLGLILFNFFRSSTSFATNAISSSSKFVKSMKIPYEALVVAVIFQSIFSHLFEVIVFMIILFFFGSSLVGMFFYLPLLLFFVLFVLGIAFILATIGTYISDTTNVWAVIVRILWFATPIFYIIKPGTKIYALNLFNPIYYFIDVARTIILDQALPGFWSLFVIFLVSVFTFVVGILVFEKYKNKFAEMI